MAARLDAQVGRAADHSGLDEAVPAGLHEARASRGLGGPGTTDAHFKSKTTSGREKHRWINRAANCSGRTIVPRESTSAARSPSPSSATPKSARPATTHRESSARLASAAGLGSCREKSGSTAQRRGMTWQPDCRSTRGAISRKLAPPSRRRRSSGSYGRAPTGRSRDSPAARPRTAVS